MERDRDREKQRQRDREIKARRLVGSPRKEVSIDREEIRLQSRGPQVHLQAQ